MIILSFLILRRLFNYLKREDLITHTAFIIIDAARKKETGIKELLGILCFDPLTKARNYQELRQNISSNLHPDLPEDEEVFRAAIEVVWFYLISKHRPNEISENWPLSITNLWGEEIVFIPVFPEQRNSRFADFTSERASWQARGYTVCAEERYWWSLLGALPDVECISNLTLLTSEQAGVTAQDIRRLALEHDVFEPRRLKWTYRLRRLRLWFGLKLFLPLAGKLARSNKFPLFKAFSLHYDLSPVYLKLQREAALLNLPAKPDSLATRFFLPAEFSLDSGGEQRSVQALSEVEFAKEVLLRPGRRVVYASPAAIMTALSLSKAEHTIHINRLLSAAAPAYSISKSNTERSSSIEFKPWLRKWWEESVSPLLLQKVRRPGHCFNQHIISPSLQAILVTIRDNLRSHFLSQEEARLALSEAFNTGSLGSIDEFLGALIQNKIISSQVAHLFRENSDWLEIVTLLLEDLLEAGTAATDTAYQPDVIQVAPGVAIRVHRFSQENSGQSRNDISSFIKANTQGDNTCFASAHALGHFRSQLSFCQGLNEIDSLREHSPWPLDRNDLDGLASASTQVYASPAYAALKRFHPAKRWISGGLAVDLTSRANQTSLNMARYPAYVWQMWELARKLVRQKVPRQLEAWLDLPPARRASTLSFIDCIAFSREAEILRYFLRFPSEIEQFSINPQRRPQSTHNRAGTRSPYAALAFGYMQDSRVLSGEFLLKAVPTMLLQALHILPKAQGNELALSKLAMYVSYYFDYRARTLARKYSSRVIGLPFRAISYLTHPWYLRWQTLLLEVRARQEYRLEASRDWPGLTQDEKDELAQRARVYHAQSAKAALAQSNRPIEFALNCFINGRLFSEAELTGSPSSKALESIARELDISLEQRVFNIEQPASQKRLSEPLDRGGLPFNLNISSGTLTLTNPRAFAGKPWGK
ncbi:MAG: hypothetical protein PHT41_08125, partial [Candidatus Omnitrophica bacterium]|nr:hypothetical protein [Candidatus Omnitrophota bacterium]